MLTYAHSDMIVHKILISGFNPIFPISPIVINCLALLVPSVKINVLIPGKMMQRIKFPPTTKRLASKKINDLKKSLSKNIAGIIWGSLSAFCISFLVWCFAYFGYTDLGLPVRYDYEILNSE